MKFVATANDTYPCGDGAVSQRTDVVEMKNAFVTNVPNRHLSPCGVNFDPVTVMLIGVSAYSIYDDGVKLSSSGPAGLVKYSWITIKHT